MRKREIQSFTLKLNDLKEYEAVRQERLAAKLHEKLSDSQSQQSAPQVQPLFIKFGPKSKQEVRERLGFNME